MSSNSIASVSLRLRNRFTKSNRLRSRRQFKYLFSTGRKLNYKNFLAIVCKATPEVSELAPQTAKSNAKLGIIIPKSMVPLAVCRNKLRRIIRESFRLNCRHLSDYELIIILRTKDKNAINDNYAFRTMTDELWGKIVATGQNRECRAASR